MVGFKLHDRAVDPGLGHVERLQAVVFLLHIRPEKGAAEPKRQRGEHERGQHHVRGDQQKSPL